MRLRQERKDGVRLAFWTLALVLAGYVGLGALRIEAAASFAGLNLANAVELGATLLVLARIRLVRDGREAWLPLAVGMSSYLLGFVVYAELVAHRHPIPYPSLADGFWLAIYPCLFVTIALRARSGGRGSDAGLWLDAVVGALAVSAAGSALFLKPLLRSATGGTATVATSLAYPFSDLTLLAFLAVALTLTGARPLRSWIVFGSGLAIFAVSDSLYVKLATTGTYTTGGLLDAGWAAGMLLLAAAAWQPPIVTRAASGGLRRLALALPASGVALVLLLAGSDRIGVVAAVLAAATLAVSLIRSAYALALEGRLHTTRVQAITDELTGLGNRRRFLEALEQTIDAATSREPRALALFDLDGFKHYNDSFGHLAGDQLLQHLAGRLAEAVGDMGSAYRLGGDEFCVLLAGDPRRLDELLPKLEAALSDECDGLRIGCSYGVALLPQETQDARAALALADRRMYERKERSRRSTRLQMRDLLLAAVEEQQPQLRGHSFGVSGLCRLVGERLGMSRPALDLLEYAAQLHDIGKIAISDAVINKPGPLNEAEWEVMRQHTLIGDRILRSVPTLAPVAEMVRASHEHFDGTGYPEGLTGEQIPLGARVIAACDAFDAMLSDRPYRAALNRERAEAELRRHAGTQFDPEIVYALLDILRDRELPRQPARERTSTLESPTPRLTTIASLRGLLEISRLARSSTSLEAVLDAIARVVSESLGLGTVVINLRLPGTEIFEVTTVHTTQPDCQALLGTTNTLAEWEPLLAREFYVRGAYHIRAGEFDWSALGDNRVVVGQVAGDDPWLWHPEDELFVPFYCSDGRLLGIFSLGEPTSRRKPSDDELDILVAVAEHAADAIESVQAHAAARARLTAVSA